LQDAEGEKGKEEGKGKGRITPDGFRSRRFAIGALNGTDCKSAPAKTGRRGHIFKFSIFQIVNSSARADLQSVR
jgi:hypothetical protein